MDRESKETMKKFTYRFRSIMVNHVERVIPGTIFSKMVLEMDDTAVEEHAIELTLKDILRDTAWITNFLLSLMIVLPVSGILFFGVYAGFGKGMDQTSWSIIKLIFIASGIITFTTLWVFLSVKVSIGNKKREHVENIRGKGNWRLVDESEWNNFYRLLMIAKNQRENEKTIK